MSSSRRTRKAMHFDFDTHKLEAVFGDGKRRRGYAEVQSCLSSYGFDHRQWSGYVSRAKMSYAQAYDVLRLLAIQCPWIVACSRRFDVTDFVEESDALEYFGERGAVYALAEELRSQIVEGSA